MGSACIHMPKLQEVDRADGLTRRRDICQAYADDAASFIGQQEKFGVAAGLLALVTASLGAGLSDVENGNAFTRHRKLFLLSAAAPLGVTSFVLLSNARAAAISSSEASTALKFTQDDAMWAGCQTARSGYFDARAASIASANALIDAKRKEAEGPAEVSIAQITNASEASSRAAERVQQAIKLTESAKKVLEDAQACVKDFKDDTKDPVQVKKRAAVKKAEAQLELLTKSVQTVKDEAKIALDEATKAAAEAAAARTAAAAKAEKAAANSSAALETAREIMQKLNDERAAACCKVSVRPPVESCL